MIDKKILEEFIEKELEGTDQFLVDLEIGSDNLIKVEIDSDSMLDIDRCVELSRDIEKAFEPEIGDYELEVGTAGLTSPFKVKRQYKKNIGREVEVLTKEGKKLKGMLRKADEEGFVLETEEKVKPEGSKKPVLQKNEKSFGYDDVKYVKYLLKF